MGSMKEPLLSLQADPFNGLGALTPCFCAINPWNLLHWWQMVWFRINETKYLCHCIKHSWRNWHQILNQRKTSMLPYFLPWKFCLGREGKKDLAICLGFLGSEQPSQSNPLQQAAFSLEVWTNGHCKQDWLEQQGQVSSRAQNPRELRVHCNTSQVSSAQWYLVGLCWMCLSVCMWQCFRVPQMEML